MITNENVKTNLVNDVISKATSSQLFWVVSFSILTAFSAQVMVPVEPVPFTLQTVLVLLSGAFLGSRNGFYSQITYLMAGAAGLPVFAGMYAGAHVLFGPTGGYLIAFPFAAYLTGAIIESRRTTFNVIVAMVAGTAVILLTGALYLSTFFNGDLGEALFNGALVFSLWDILKIAATLGIYKAISVKFPKLPA